MKWTDDEVSYLKETYANGSIGNMSSHLQRGVEAIHKKASKLNLRRNVASVMNNNLEHGFNGPNVDFNKSIRRNGFVFPIKALNLSGKIPVKIDHRTVVYCNPGQEQHTRNKYKPLGQ